MIGRIWTDDDRTVEVDEETLPERVRDDAADEDSDDRRLREERPPHWD